MAEVAWSITKIMRVDYLGGDEEVKNKIKITEVETMKGQYSGFATC